MKPFRPSFLGLAAVLLLAGCATPGAAPEGDVATYDTLRQLREQCTAQGKELALKSGGNERRLSGYECRGK
jgi:outer membrane protein assembly factor BamE (lipoprotein component of BamABCDE complex)